jgi:autotransporter-associated beta strand protein
MYTPPYMGGAATVQASSGGFNGTGSVTFTGQAQWNSAANADWNASGSWKDTISGATIAAPGLRGIEGDTLLLASATGGTISLDGQSPTVASIAFNNAATSYTIAQGSGGSVSLAGSGASVAVYAGNHSISAPLGLAANTTFTVASGSSLTVTRPVSGNGGLLKSGGGKLELSAANLYTGGTTVTAGILEVGNSAGLLDGSSLTVSAGGLFSFDLPVEAVAVQPSATASTRLVSMPRLATSPGSQAIVHGESLSANGLTTPAVDPVIWLRSASLPAPLDKGNGGHVRNLAWLGLAASRTDQGDSMDQSNKKVQTLLALEAVFAQYGL